MDPFELKKRYSLNSEDVLAKWRHQIRWQIYLPLGLGLLTLGLLIGLIIASQVGDESAWADVSLILLSALALILGFVGLVILVAVVIGVIYLIRVVPLPFDRTREAAFDAQASVAEVSEAAVKPVIAPKAATYALITGIRYLAGMFKG
ncbi:MAG: hypothetical protein ACE5JF_03420 [Anaerolineales bacterium]